MKRFLCLSAFVALTFAGTATYAADECTKLTATGHPDYPILAFKSGDQIVGAAATLVETIAKKLNVPIESKYTGNWSAAQAAARDGKVDIIFGLYHTEDRAKYLDYVDPAFMFDDVAIFVPKGKEFTFTGKDDLIGKKGVTNEGESFGDSFDAFMEKKLNVSRTDGLDAAFKDLLDGKADFLIAGHHPGQAEAIKQGIEDKVEVLDQALLSEEMFVAFSKKSPCLSLIDGFSQAITELTTDGSFTAMEAEAQTAWDKAH